MTKGNLLSLTFTNIKGDILAVLGAVAYGLFSVLGKNINLKSAPQLYSIIVLLLF